MLQLTDPAQVRQECDRQRQAGKRVGLVPTMGFLHQGHTALIRRAAELGDFVVVSIFVNPTQFGPGEDLESYPRDIDGDLDKCRRHGTALVFSPEVPQLYPDGYQTHVTVEQVSQGLCGERRPVHFCGVATVVTKLLNIVGPCVAVFGQKDYQQLLVIRRLVLDLDMPVQVVGHPTVREDDGLAKSSRNAYLTEEQRRSAPALYRALCAIRDQAGSKTMPADEAVALAREIIEAEPRTRIDYVEARDAETLEPATRVGGGRSVVALAVFLGKARLIDNMVI